MKELEPMTTRAARRACGLVAAILIPATACAHPGHAAMTEGDWSFLLHYLAQHVQVAGAIAVVLITAGVLVTRAMVVRKPAPREDSHV